MVPMLIVLAFQFWFTLLTFVNQIINQSHSEDCEPIKALTFRRLEQGINYFAVTQQTYAAFFHNWLLAVKFSVVLQVILFRKFL